MVMEYEHIYSTTRNVILRNMKWDPYLLFLCNFDLSSNTMSSIKFGLNLMMQ